MAKHKSGELRFPATALIMLEVHCNDTYDSFIIPHHICKHSYLLTGLNPAVYEDRIKESWIYPELKAARNVRPSFNTKLGIWGGLAYTGLFYIMARGKEPWTLNINGKTVCVLSKL